MAWLSILWVYTQSGITGSWGRLFPNFLKNHHTDIQRVCTLLKCFFKAFKKHLFLFYVYRNFAYMYDMHRVCVVLKDAHDSSELPCGCWESNPGHLEEDWWALTTEPSLQPQMYLFMHMCVLSARTPAHWKRALSIRMSHHVDAGKWTQERWKNSECS